MSYKVVLSTSFKKSVKQLKKRFPSVTKDVSHVIEELTEDPKIGTVIPHGHGVRKLRVRNSNLERGKSGGYRLVYDVVDEPEPTVYLLLLYSKSDKQNVTTKELSDLLRELRENLNTEKDLDQ
jgi:addiction module RelE/StbE family toxin